MIYPVSAYLLVGRGKGEIIFNHRVREKGGVEVDAYASFLCELYPFCKMTGGERISVRAVVYYSVASVEIELFLAGDERERLVHISHKLLGRGSLAGIISRRLNTA